jgi:DNA-binding protein HU-beta
VPFECGAVILWTNGCVDFQKSVAAKRKPHGATCPPRRRELAPRRPLPYKACVTLVSMTKNNLIDCVSEATKGTKKDAELVVDLVIHSITEALVKGEKVELRGFGSFQVSGKKERQGRNPRTGETLTIAARNVAVFKPSKELSGRLNGITQEGGEALDTAKADAVAQPSEGSTKIHGDKIKM